MADQINQMNKMLDPSSTVREMSGAEDLALVTSLMKMLDPSSTVREGKMATEGSSMMDSLQMVFDDIMIGNKLTPEIRQRLVDQGIGMMDQMSGAREIDPNMVIREGEMQQMNKPIDI